MSYTLKQHYNRRWILVILLVATIAIVNATGRAGLPLTEYPSSGIRSDNQPSRINFIQPQFDETLWTGYTNPYNYQCMFEDDWDIYMGSPFGVTVYNKANSTSRVLNTANSGLNSNFVNSIAKDNQGNMWYTHTQPFSIDEAVCGGISVQHQNGTWTYYNYETNNIPSNTISSIAFDAEGYAWIGFFFNPNSPGGLVRLNPQTGEWIHYTKHNSILPANTVLSIYLASDNSIWVTTCGDVDPVPYIGGGLLRIQDGIWTAYSTEIAHDPAENRPDWYIKNIVEDSQGNMWFCLSGSVDTGLFKFDGTCFTKYQYPDDLIPQQKEDELERVTMYWDVAIDSLDRIFINAIIFRVVIFDDDQWQLASDPYNLISGHLLQNIFMGNDGTIWVAKYDGDLAQIVNDQVVHAEMNSNNPFKSMNHIWGMNARPNGTFYAGTGWYAFGEIPIRTSLHEIGEGIWNNYGYNDYQNYVVNDIAFDDQDYLYLATGDSSDEAAVIMDMFGGVSIYDGISWTNYTMINSDYPFLYAAEVEIDTHGHIWAGTATDGLAVLRNGSWTAYTRENTPDLYTNTITDIATFRDQPLVWIASTVGLYKVNVSDPLNYQWDVYHPGNSILTSGLINALHLDPTGKLWIGTDKGLASWDNGVWTSYNSQIGQLAITDLSQDEYGRLWIATVEEGLLLLDSEDVYQWKRQNSPIPTNYVAKICSDRHGTLWINPYGNGLYALTYTATLDENDVSITPVSSLNLKNYPNPFNPKTTISFELEKAGTALVEVYNHRGQLVKTLADGPLTAGTHRLMWDGKDQSGSNCATGIYLCKIKTREEVRTHKMSLIK